MHKDKTPHGVGVNPIGMVGSMADALLYRVAWWASERRVDWLCDLIYRYRCPYPIGKDHSVRTCVASGHCACDNAPAKPHQPS